MAKAPSFNFQESKDKETITLYDFEPRSQETLNLFLESHKGRSLFFFQKTHEGFNTGSLYSYILYAQNVEIKSRLTAEGSVRFSIEKGLPQDSFSAVKELAIAQNKNEVIFPYAFLEQFKTNSILITDKDLSVQLYDDGKLIGHVSVVKTEFPLFSEKNLYLLMRFIVHEDYQKTEAKEVLVDEVSKFLPTSASLCLQVFPNNQKALRFFLRRMNANIVSEKWKI